jgi:hypothetical protein
MVDGKDPSCEYSFRKTSDIEQGGGMDRYGYEPVTAANHTGETWAGPKAMRNRAKNVKQIINTDTILCKRDLETARFFHNMEDEKYNAQCRLVLTASQQANVKLRELDPGAVVVNESKGLKEALPQRPGPTEE